MLLLIRPRFALALIVIVFFTVFLLMIAVRVLGFQTSVWAALFTGFSFALTATTIFTSIPQSYSFLIKCYNRIPVLTPLLDLNGRWRVSLQSNWPRIQSLSAHGESPAVVADLREVRGTLELQSNLYKTLGRFSLDGDSADRPSRTMRSDLIASSLREEDRRYVFSYVAKAAVSKPDPTTDEQSYLVAAEIHFDSDNLSKGFGSYWTNRKYSSGHNAAGEIVLARVQSE